MQGQASRAGYNGTSFFDCLVVFLYEGMLREMEMVNKSVSIIMETQVVSKKRVADHGEVYTGRREVNAMLDLVK